MTDAPPVAMQTFGQRLGARQSTGRANWSEEIVEHPVSGMVNLQLVCPHPRDGRRRRAEIDMRGADGRWSVVADAWFDGDCRLSGFSLRDDPVFADQRLASFVTRYASKLSTLDCLSQQREYPLQSPWHPWLLLRPGDVAVVD